jgi:hypothetical protein
MRDAAAKRAALARPDPRYSLSTEAAELGSMASMVIDRLRIFEFSAPTPAVVGRFSSSPALSAHFTAEVRTSHSEGEKSSISDRCQCRQRTLH